MFDLQKWLAKTGIEFHWPGYQYMGPGTHLAERLKRGDPGKSRLDRLVKQHDIDYSRAKTLQDKWKADEKNDPRHFQVAGTTLSDGENREENHASDRSPNTRGGDELLFVPGQPSGQMVSSYFTACHEERFGNLVYPFPIT